MLLTFPILVLRLDPLSRALQWRWRNMALAGLGAFALALVWDRLSARRGRAAGPSRLREAAAGLAAKVRADPRLVRLCAGACLAFALAFPLLFDLYQTNIMVQALIYVVLGLGLNVTVGLAGLLDLGYVAYFAMGAYAYGLLSLHVGLGFWAALPLGGLLGALFGFLLGLPVLRLKGDYLAIVTLGFAEILRRVLENWTGAGFGPSGISNIGRPGLFGLELHLSQATAFVYYILLGLVGLVAWAVGRLKRSRVGLAWQALREDELACQAMGVDTTRAKLLAISLGAGVAGLGGVVFAAKNAFINPACFTFLESALVLSIVVLGGMGSLVGVLLGAAVLVLLPEHLRVLSECRMLVFGAALVLVMIFRPEGLAGGRPRSTPPAAG
jgi:branched-chain amino acid transport system permease protein